MDDQVEIFTAIKNLMTSYAPPMTSKVDDVSHYDLWSFKDLVITGRKRKEIYFAGLVIQKDYVGFYYMPIYARPDLKTVFAPELIKLLKGKSCFHIKILDDSLLEQIRLALKIGFEFYQKKRLGLNQPCQTKRMHFIDIREPLESWIVSIWGPEIETWKVCYNLNGPGPNV